MIVTLGILFGISLLINIIMVVYARNSLSKLETVYTASETTAEIFSMMDSYKEHLSGVYDMPTFYGDDTLKSLLDHTGELIEYLKGYEEIYSFTQPDLELQLASVSAEMEEERHEEEAQEK